MRKGVRTVANLVRTAFIAAIFISTVTASPLFAQTGNCAVDIGLPLPDLIVDLARLQSHIMISEERFSPQSCSVEEGFIPNAGPHTLFRFTTDTPNVGQGNLHIGNPEACSALFEFSSCHGHYHFHEYADYRLWTLSGYAAWLAGRDLSQPSDTGNNAVLLAEATKKRDLVSGNKMGYCMIDTDPYTVAPGTPPTYTSCMLNQGLTAGWTDRYDARLDGQWVEIDHLKEGEYILEIHVNAEHLLPESNYLNNTTAIQVRYTPRKGAIPPQVANVP